MSDPIYIFSGNQRQAEEYIHRHRLKPSEYQYISEPDKLRGTRGGAYIEVGTPWSHHRSHNIYSMLISREYKKEESHDEEFYRGV